jgi:20S proteasome subunit alpha 6
VQVSRLGCSLLAWLPRVCRCRYMRSECLNHKYVFGSEMPVGRLLLDVGDKHQECTQSYVRRPYGVGLLVAGVDKTGGHLYQTCPSGSIYEFKAYAIGARSQSARTYFDKHHESFPEAVREGGRDRLILHALKALSTCTEAEEELTADNTSVGVVEVGGKFELLEGAEVAPALEALKSFHPTGEAASAASASSSTAAAEADDEDVSMA